MNILCQQSNSPSTPKLKTRACKTGKDRLSDFEHGELLLATTIYRIKASKMETINHITCDHEQEKNMCEHFTQLPSFNVLSQAGCADLSKHVALAGTSL